MDAMQIFHREQRSLFGEILDWMLIPMLLMWPASLALTWLVAQNIADKPFDRTLVANVRTLARLVKWQDGQVQFFLPAQGRELLRTDSADQVFFQVLGPYDQWIGGEHQFPQPESGDRELPPGEVDLRNDVLRTASGRQVDVRVARLRAIASEADAYGVNFPKGRIVTIQVAETREQRSLLAAEIIKGVMLPQFVILPITMLMIWMALSRGLRPLSELQDRIRARKPGDLSPLDQQIVPVEVAPLVGSVNEMIERQKDMLDTQKHFLANAAHQLKTPLAGLRMQADLALRSDAGADDLKRSLQQIGRSSIRATHTVNQLLALARAESGSLARQPCNMARLVQEVMQECLPGALAKNLDLGYEGAGAGSPGVWVEGNPILLSEMVRNLVDNAINYTPASQEGQPGVVTVRVLADPGQQLLVVQVEDNGPGIAADEREQVFKPFYRTLGNEADGSGLGLPIVQEIASQHGASVTVEEAPLRNGRRGALFSIRFDGAAISAAAMQS